MNFGSKTSRKISPFLKTQTNEALTALSTAIDHEEKLESPPKKKVKVGGSSDSLLGGSAGGGGSPLKDIFNSKNTNHHVTKICSPRKHEREDQSELPAFLFTVSEVKPDDGVVEVTLKKIDNNSAESICILADSW